MKNLIVIWFCIVSLTACQENNHTLPNTELIGNWRLVEVLSDPGDGSGVFVTVDSEKTMTFQSDGTLTSNGSLCDLYFTDLIPSSGAYSLIDSTYTTNDCGFADVKYAFEQYGNTLVLSYPCIEACQSKFVKEYEP